jgi:hypothetical protein
MEYISLYTIIQIILLLAACWACYVKGKLTIVEMVMEAIEEGALIVAKDAKNALK